MNTDQLQKKIHQAVIEAAKSSDVPETRMLYAEPGQSKSVISERVTISATGQITAKFNRGPVIEHLKTSDQKIPKSTRRPVRRRSRKK